MKRSRVPSPLLQVLYHGSFDSYGTKLTPLCFSPTIGSGFVCTRHSVNLPCLVKWNYMKEGENLTEIPNGGFANV